MNAENKPGIPPTCRWTEDEDGCWRSKCGIAFEMYGGTPSENSMRFCHGCGKRLEEQPYREPTEPESP